MTHGDAVVEKFLAGGDHTVTLYVREDGTRLDKLELVLIEAAADTDTAMGENTYLGTLGAGQVWDLGIQGQGITVAVIDSGISISPDFGTVSSTDSETDVVTPCLGPAATLTAAMVIAAACRLHVSWFQTLALACHLEHLHLRIRRNRQLCSTAAYPMDALDELRAMDRMCGCVLVSLCARFDSREIAPVVGRGRSRNT